MKDTLIQFKDVIDEEIQAYESLDELYKIKQSILTQGKSDELWDVDAKIIDKANVIRELNGKRKLIAGYFGDENFSMSDIVEKAKQFDVEIAGKLELQRNKLNILAKSISLQEKINMSLIKHGLVMVGKSIDIIVDAVLPHMKGQYDKKGHTIQNDKRILSSVVEEA